MDSGRARNTAWPWRWSSKTGSICWWSCPPYTANRPCSWSRRWSPLTPSSWWCLWQSSSANATRAGLQHATYRMDTIMFDDTPSILFVSVEHAATPRLVELAHTLNHLQKLHYVVMDEAHLMLSNFKLVMKHLLPLWAVGCQLIALTASLSPFQETNLKIVMFARFAVVRMSTLRPLIEYVVNEVTNVDEEIIRQFIE